MTLAIEHELNEEEISDESAIKELKTNAKETISLLKKVRLFFLVFHNQSRFIQRKFYKFM